MKQILELVEDETKITTEIEEAADFNERIYECMVKIGSILCLKQLAKVPQSLLVYQS